MGGGELIASFLDELSIDEFVITVAQVFIGDGIPLIATSPPRAPGFQRRSNASRMVCFNCVTAFKGPRSGLQHLSRRRRETNR